MGPEGNRQDAPPLSSMADLDGMLRASPGTRAEPDAGMPPATVATSPYSRGRRGVGLASTRGARRLALRQPPSGLDVARGVGFLPSSGLDVARGAGFLPPSGLALPPSGLALAPSGRALPLPFFGGCTGLMALLLRLRPHRRAPPGRCRPGSATDSLSRRAGWWWSSWSLSWRAGWRLSHAQSGSASPRRHAAGRYRSPPG